jgi:hypothetical protein
LFRQWRARPGIRKLIPFRATTAFLFFDGVISMAKKKQVHARELGDPFPLVKLPSVHGGEIDFKSFRGKRLLIFSWSSW